MIKDFIVHSNLNSVIEKDQFILDNDSLYCVRESCKDCKYELVCENTEENLALQNNLTLATRPNIKIGKPSKEEWYLPELTKQEDLDYMTLTNSRYIPDDLSELPTRLKKLLVLSDSKKTIYKQVQEIKGQKIPNIEHILYQQEDETYYCLKDSCLSCKHLKACKHKIVIEDKEDVFVAIDSASQEPMIITYLSFEPEYVRVFANNSIKDIEYLLEPLNDYFTEAKGIDIEDNEHYMTFVDYLAFDNKTELLNFSSSVYNYIKDNNLKNKKELDTQINNIEAIYHTFKELVKSGKIEIAKIFN